LQALLITRSEQGMTLLQEGRPALNLPTRAREVYDVSGAGDTAIAVLAATLAVEYSLPVAASLANIAAGIVVRKFGTATVSIPELRRALQRYSDAELGVLSEEQLLIAVTDAREHDETIVMTNGCFDILHAGHVAYLEEAKKLGKRLIVAINDDASVVRLKGSKRPLNTLAQRMSIIAALRAVDWVVAFTEDTPQRLISRVLPDVLVKGGDYQRIEEIAGAAEVLENGGEVKILPFLEGHSTTGLIEKIREYT
jgi:D-beta-D-heptose 7-phosphate kinase/D-beta-D-heptose 1-phosphate adenosyltransferase